MQRLVKTICVFCGARAGNHPSYLAAAQDFGAEMAKNDWRLIFGAGDQGIMGAVAKASAEAGGAQVGVIPTHLIGKELTGEMAARTIITENMHERKKVMHMNSDAAVVLPGGAGSLDEFFEVLTWRQLGLHDKPIILLNVNGYWDKLIALLDHVIAEGFAEPSIKSFVTVSETVPELVEQLRRDFA